MSRLTRFLGIAHPDSLTAHPPGPRLRVVINALHAKSGGGVTYLRNILPLMADDARLDLHVFLHRSQLALFDPLDRRVVVHVFDFPPGFARLMAWEQLVLPLMARMAAADLVFSPANFGSVLIGRQVILLRNALAVARTETRWSKRLYWVALGLITLVSLLRAKRAIAVSRYAADSLSLGLKRLFGDKISVIHHGIAPRFTPDPAVHRQDFILAVSDIYVQKNLHTLFRAMTPVFQRHPHLRLLVAGEKIDPWYYDHVTALAASQGLLDRITFLGRVGGDDLLRLYRQCLMFVFPSTAETFGNPLVEAMACGAPVACSNTTAMPEIVDGAALLFDPLDSDGMAAAILRMLADGDLRDSLSRQGVRRAAAFSWRDTAARTCQILVDAAESAGRRQP